MNNLCFYGFHGALEEENTIGQRFYLDVRLYTDLRRAGKTDDLEHTINYAAAYQIIKEQCERRTYRLIETLAENIAADLFLEFKGIDEVEIEVRKPSAPVKGSFDFMGVRITRTREESGVKTAYLSLGSNIGDRKEYLESAVSAIMQLRDTRIAAVSKIYETPPWGEENQDPFLNLCMEIRTSLKPCELLSELQRIEKENGRKRIRRWGPRTLDIDILIYEDFVSEEEKLILPHPRMGQRAFVLVPLQEIAPGLLIEGKDISEILKALDKEQIKEFRD